MEHEEQGCPPSQERTEEVTRIAENSELRSLIRGLVREALEGFDFYDPTDGGRWTEQARGEHKEIAAEFEAALDRDSLNAVKRKYRKLLDSDAVSARLEGFVDWLAARQKAYIVSKWGEGAFQKAPKQTTAADSRVDQILRTRDSSGRARARKF